MHFILSFVKGLTNHLLSHLHQLCRKISFIGQDSSIYKRDYFGKISCQLNKRNRSLENHDCPAESVWELVMLTLTECTMDKGTKQWLLGYSLEIRKNLFTRRGVQHWKSCPGTPILGDIQNSSLSRSLGLNATQKCCSSKTALILLDRNITMVLTLS